MTDMPMGNAVRAEYERIARILDDATAKAALDGTDPLAAAMHVAFAEALRDLRVHLPRLERAIAQPVEPGSFLLGMTAAGFAMQGADAVHLVENDSARPVLLAYLRKARER